MLPDTDPTESAHLTISQVHGDFIKAIEAADCAERCIQLAARINFLILVLTSAREVADAKAIRLQP